MNNIFFISALFFIALVSCATNTTTDTKSNVVDELRSVFDRGVLVASDSGTMPSEFFTEKNNAINNFPNEVLF